MATSRDAQPFFSWKRVAGIALIGLFALVGAGCTGSSSAPRRSAEPTVPGSPSGTVPSLRSKLLQPEDLNLFSPRSVWRQTVVAAPLAPDSAAMVENLVGQVANRWGGNAAFNAYQYNVNWYNVGPHVATTRVAFSNCQHKASTPPGLYGPRGQFTKVPVPKDAVPAAGTDATMTLYQRSTDTLWELWKAARTASGWKACWGGRIDHVSTNRGYFSHGFGASATGLVAAAGDISISDVRRGSIDHAVYLAIPRPALYRYFVWPAQRSDGNSGAPTAIPEGARLRLNPDMNVDSLGLSAIGTMIARAAQKYGFIVTNRSGAVAVTTESGMQTKEATGKNPWAAILGATKPYRVLKGFPWQDVQVIQYGWGR